MLIIVTFCVFGALKRQITDFPCLVQSRLRKKFIRLIQTIHETYVPGEGPGDFP